MASSNIQAIQATSVLVRVTGPDPKGAKIKGRSFYSIDAGRTTLSASGFICHTLPTADEDKDKDQQAVVTVVTSASLLAPFIKLDLNGQPLETLIQGCVVDVCLEDTDNGARLLEQQLWYRAELHRIIKLPAVSRAASSLIGNQSLSVVRGIDVGCLAVLHVLPRPEAEFSILKMASNSSRLAVSAAALNRGDSLTIVASPFGLVSPKVFQNSVTNGIVSNVIPASQPHVGVALLLTDARCLAGSEGGAAYDATNRLVGIVTPAILRKDGSAVELNAIIPVDQFNSELRMLLAAFNTDSTDRPSRSLSEYLPSSLLEQVGTGEEDEEDLASAVRRCAEGVVLIQINSSWGTGITVTEDGYVLTCAHLFKSFVKPDATTGRLFLPRYHTIHVTYRDTEHRLSCTAELLFCSKGAIDVALLQLHTSSRTSKVEVCSASIPSVGQSVVALGHAIFDPNVQLRLTASRGRLSKVVIHGSRRTAQPAILQTCSHVFRGHSGGLLADERGRMLGMLTSNARHSDGSIIPTINFSIPVAVLLPLVRCAQGRAERETVFDSYDAVDRALEALWKLEVGGAPDQLPPSVHQSSRFADFLESFNNNNPPSKL